MKKRPDEIDDAIECLEQAEIEKYQPDGDDDGGPNRPARRQMGRPRMFTV